MTPSSPSRRMVCSGDYTIFLLVLFGGWSAQAIKLLSNLSFSADDGLHRPFVLFRRVSCLSYSADGLFHQMSGREHQIINNICSTVVSFRAWSSGLLHVLVFRVPRFESQSKRARMRDRVPEVDLQLGKAPYEKAPKTRFSRHISPTLDRDHTCLLQAITHPCPGFHTSLLPTCPFRGMVCTGLLLVLFSGWSAHLSYLSFSAEGLHRPPHISYFSAEGLHRLSYLSSLASFSADGLHKPLPACPFRRMICRALLLVLSGGWSAQALLLVRFGVLFGGWSAQAIKYLLLVLFGGWSAVVSYLSFSAAGPHYTSLLLVHGFDTSLLLVLSSRRLVCTGLLLVLFGRRLYRLVTSLLSFLASFSADGLHRPLHMSYFSAEGLQSSPTCPFRRMVCTSSPTSPFRPPFRRMVCTGHNMSPTCPFWRRVCTPLLLVLFGGWSAQALLLVRFGVLFGGWSA